MPDGAHVQYEVVDAKAMRATATWRGIRIAVADWWGRFGLPSRVVFFGPDGAQCGVERERGHGDAVIWTATWHGGAMQGDSLLLDESGHLIAATTFAHGTGLDLWGGDAELGEIRPLRDGELHGAVLWGAVSALSAEDHFVAGRKHGPQRAWGADGQLEPGFPRFFVNDVAVDHVRYAAACTTDDRLRPYDPADDLPLRAQPPAVAAALARGADMAATFEIGPYLEAADRAWLALFKTEGE